MALEWIGSRWFDGVTGPSVRALHPSCVDMPADGPGKPVHGVAEDGGYPPTLQGSNGVYRRPRRLLSWPLALAIILAPLVGCDKIGPMRELHPENTKNSPSRPEYQPPADEKPILDKRTGEPMAPHQPNN